MEEPRPEKVAVVEEVRERFAASSAAILTEYRGLKVQEMQTLRRALTAAGGDYKVYKNTLVRRAAHESGLAGLEPLLEGPTGIAFVRDDVAAVAKVLRDFARTSPALVVKGGLVGRSLFDAKDATRIADLPSRDVLLSQLAGALAAPLQKLAALMKALPQNLAYGISALVDARGGVPAAGESEASVESSASSAEETASGSDASTAAGAPDVVAAGVDESAGAGAPEVDDAAESAAARDDSGAGTDEAADALAEAAAEAEAALSTQPPPGDEADPASADEAATPEAAEPADGAGPEAVS